MAPLFPRRLFRAKQLIRAYHIARKDRQKYIQQRKRSLLRLFRQARQRKSDSDHSSFESDTESTSDSTSTTNSNSSESCDNWAAILGPEWRDLNARLGVAPSVSLGDIMQELLPQCASVVDSAGSDTSHGTNSTSDISMRDGEGLENDSDIEMLDWDADDESSLSDWEEQSEDLEDKEGSDGWDPKFNGLDRWERLRRWVVHSIEEMYAERYEAPRDPLPRGPSFLQHILLTLKTARPDHFRQELRVSPQTFDSIVSAIEKDPVFFNNSNNSQLPVEEQLAITLYRFGHDGNSASLQSVANWAGVGKGTVLLATRRVTTAILRPSFMNNAVRYPTEAEKDEAKRWVRRRSCKAWQGGWCMVDGTLVPLAERPHWFGESYFYRKNRYSLSFQVCNQRSALSNDRELA